MTRDDIIRMAREAVQPDETCWLAYEVDFLERFAALVAQQEREACANLCDEYAAFHQKAHIVQMETAADWCAVAIRGRGES